MHNQHLVGTLEYHGEQTHVCRHFVYTTSKMFLAKQTVLNALKIVRPNLINANVPTIGLRSYKRWLAPTLKELKRRTKRAMPVETRRSSFFEWNYDAEIFAFGKRLGEAFKPDVLKRALTHRSYVIQLELQAEREESTEKVTLEDNRTYIENGDKILVDSIKNHLKKQKYALEIEHILINHLTSEEMLSDVATNIGLKDLILTEEHPESDITLANTFKAVIYALHVSTNSDEIVDKFLADFLLAQLNQVDPYSLWNLAEPYKALEAMANSRGLTNIEPRICNQSAVNTILANYQIGLYSDKKLIGIGFGESIEIAKDSAAVDAIKKLHNS